MRKSRYIMKGYIIVVCHHFHLMAYYTAPCSYTLATKQKTQLQGNGIQLHRSANISGKVIQYQWYCSWVKEVVWYKNALVI